MLIEMKSPAFKEKGKERSPIIFKEGLNVVLGKEDGENSIGKSSAMLAIDFVFGGNSYISSDGVKHIGHHTIYFAFKFNEHLYYFARNTGMPDVVYVCTRNYEMTSVSKTKQEYVDWLKEQYGMDFPGLSFRDTVSNFFRIYGKENLDERHPLKEGPGDNMQKSIIRVVKLFDRYKDIEIYNTRLDEQKKRLETFTKARKYDFISNLVGGKKQYEENLEQIRLLQMQLDNLTTEQVETSNEEEIEKSHVKAHLKDARLRMETELLAKQRRLSLLDMSMEYGLYPTEADLSELQEFFPTVNIRKLYEVEKYHKKLAVILDGQFTTGREELTGEIAELKDQIQQVKDAISNLGFVGDLSREFLDRHAEIKSHIDALKTQNAAYLTQQELQDAKKRADEVLKKAIKDILAELEREIDEKMKEFNDSLYYPEKRKAPWVHFNEYNSYLFETPDDTGTGSNYKGLVIYDLVILYLTALPAIAHDSLILKNISDGAIDGIMKIYAKSKKQIFIAFDKQDAYKDGTKQILADNMVLKLSDNNCELYGESWNKEVSENEDELQETMETTD